MEQPRYNIRAVERLTGIPAPTLRSWERRYGFPKPARTVTARRLYSDDDIRAITWVRGQTARGLSVAQAIAWARGGLGNGPGSTPALSGPPTASALVRALIDATTRYDEAAVEAALSTAFAQASADDVLLDVIAAGHRSSHHRRTRLPAERAARAGLLMLAVFLHWAGARVLYLGANVPAHDLVRLAETREIDAICLSGGRDAVWDGLPALLTDLAQLNRPPRIYLGGGAADDHPTRPGVTLLTGDLRHAATVIASGEAVGSRQ